MAQIAAEIGQGGKPKSRLEQLLEKARQTGREATLTWEPGSAAAQKYNQRSVADTTGMVSAQGALEDEIRRAENPLGASGLRHPTAEDFDRAEEDKKQARKDFWKSLILDIGLTPDYSKPVAEAERQAAQQSSADLAKARERVTRAQDRYNALASSYQSEELRGFNALDASEDFARFSQGDAETAANNPNSAYYQIYHRNDEKTPEEPANDFARALLSVGKQAAGILPGTEAYAQMTTTPYAQMTDDEAARYFYLWHAEGEGKGPKAAAAYLKLLEPKLNARANRINQQADAEFARSYPVQASAVSVPMNLAGGVMAMGDLIAQNIAQNNGSRKPIDYNTGYQQLGKTAQNYRSTIAEDLEKKYPKSILGGTLNLASFAYQTGMSMADSGLQMLMLGGLTPDTLPYRLVENFGLLLLGGSAAQQSVYAAKERGANDAQALWTGIAAGVAEAFFEKVSVDNLVKNIVAKQGVSIGDKLTKDWLKGGYQTIAAWLINMGVQGGIEGMEEVATTLANTATDYNINKDRSEILTKVKEYQKQGMSEEDALNRALKEWGIGLFQDALGGAISGGIMGGAGTGAHLLSTGVSNVTQAAKTAWEQSKVQPAEETKAPAVEETPALEMPLPERQRNPLSYALDKIKNGGTVSNSDAKAIMDNPQAMQALRDSGVLTNEGTTASEQRNAVKTAMQAYAEQQAAQEAARAAQEERRPQEASTTAAEETPRAEAQAAQQEAPTAEMPEIISRALDKINRGEEISLREAADLSRDDPSMRILRDAGLLRGEEITYEDMMTALQEYAARQAPRTESPSGLKLPVNQPLTQNRNENKITLTNNQEVTNNGQGQQAETADQRFIRLAAEQRGTVSDGSERGTRLGRFVENYRAQREYQNQERAGALLRSQAAARNLTWTSAEELGVANGSDEQTVRLLDDPSLNRTQRQTISDYAAKGVKLQFVQGMMALNERTASGKQVLARAYISKDGKHIIVQADHPYLTWKQLLDHEEFHRQIKLDKDYKEQVEKAMLADSRIAPYLSDIIDRYTAAYKEMKPGITAEDILEEMLADYRAGFDMLASSRLETGNRSVTKAAAETIKKVEEQRSKAVQAAEKTGATVVPEKTAEQSTVDITDAMADGDVGAAENFSYEALGAAGGFTAVEKDGNRYFIDQNGKRITEVTPKQVMESPIGTLLNYAAEQGWLGKNKKENQAALKQQAQFFADILTLASKNQDFAMSMNMAGAVAFTAIKANSDHQYKTTYDFKSICIKTQAIINNMSAAMVAKKGALTKDEILDIYRATARDGLPVPCPECYVFSRWIGIGGLLDNIWRYQQRYGSMTPQQVVDAYDAMVAKVQRTADEYNATAPEDKRLTFGKAKSAIAQKVTKQYNDLREKIEKADNQGEFVKEADRQKLEGLEKMMTDVKALTWIKDVYFGGKAVNAANRSEGYEVPADVLFDLNKGGEFATKYANAWAFRTTQGAGYGKAITPYAEAVLGEGILGTANLSNTLKGKAAGTLKNPFQDARGEISKDVRAKLEKAVANEKTQLFRGGQRFSSTSDMSNDVVSDLLIAMLEMQTMHAGVQMYTKVDGAVGPLTLMGAFVNQSLMPLGTGFKNGELADTSVGGMNPKVAFANREKYDRAGTITIGVNDNHIRALIKQVVRDFVIPYHASGGDANLVGEMRTVNDPGEASTKSRSTDYTRTQGDKIMTDNLLRSLGKTEEEIERIHQNRQARIAILTRGNPNMEVVRANPILSELYDRFNGGEWDGVKLPKSEIEHFIYPNEFWDTTVDYEHSGRNTQLYLDYCEALGFLHRFSGQIQQAAGNTTVLKATTGYDENGKRVPLTDLAYVYENGEKTDKIEDFFWKLLVDRRMYDNDGKYIPQGAISLSSITTGDIIDFAKNNVGRQYNEAQSQALADRIREVYDQYSNDPEAIAREVLKLINESKQQESGEEGSYSSEIAERDVQEMEDNPDTFIDSSIGERVKYSYDVDAERDFEPLRDEDGNIKYVYKAFYVMKDENGVGRLYPPMVSNVSDEEKKKVKGAVSGTQRNIYTPTGIVLTADVGMLGRYTKDTVDKQGKLHKAGELIRNTFGRLAVQNDKGGSDTLAFRPGWHLGEWPDAKQFNKNHPVHGKRSVMPDQLVFAKCEIAGTVDYQLDAMRSGVGKKGKYNRTQAGLPRVPVNGYYKYRTNPDPDTAPWYITGQMRVVEILTDEQCREICAQYGVEMSPRMSGHDIDLAEYGLKPGPVERETDTDRFLKSDKSKANESDLEAALADPEYADAYKPGEIDFSDPEILKEFERNRQDAEYYRQQYEQKYGKTSIETDPDVAAQFSPEAIALREGRSGRRAGGKKKVSKVRSNTYAVSGLFNEVEAQMEEANEQNYTYNVESERETMNKALHRLETDFAGSVKKLSSSEVWDGTDVDTAMGILHQYRTEGRMTGDYTDFWNWSHEIQRRITKDAKALQAMDKYSRTGTGQAQKAAENLRKQYQLNPAQEAKVKKAAKDILDGIDGDAEGAARDAVETAKGNKAPRDNAPALPKNVPDNSKELRAAQRRITSLQNKVTKLRQELSDLKKEYRQLGKENDRLKKQAQELKARLDAKQKELRQAQKELTKARRRIDRLEKQKENLKNQLDFEKQRRKDAERLLREASRMFEQMQQAEEAAKHGTPVKNWIPLTGEELAKRISARMEDPKAKTQTAMQTILGDLVKFAEEHALPERKTAEGQKRTAIDRITDYLNNRDAYGAAWGQAQSILRAQYADDVEKLSALEDFLGATISYNAEGTDRTMLDAILESADVLGISEKRILELASTGVTESTISRIGDELVDQVKGRMGTDYDDAYTQLLKDAARRHVNGIILKENMADQQLRLTRLTTDAARKLDTDLNRILTESRRTKTDAAQRIAAYLITELGIPSGDAAIAAQNIAGAFMDELAARADKRLQRMFADKTPKMREQRDKLLDLLRLGGFTNANVEDAVADALGIGRLSREEQRRITADMARFGETLDAMLDDDLDGLRNLIREQAAVRQTPLSPMAERVLSGEMDAKYLREFALAQLASIAGDYAPRGRGQKLGTYQTLSHLLNMRTAFRNIGSNQVFDLVASAANNVGMLPDAIASAFTGKRTVGLDKSWAGKMKRQGAVEGAGRNLLEVRLDVSPDERNKSKYGTGGRRTWSMANSGTVGKILSHLEEAMGYELNTTDEWHKGSVFAETIESFARFVDAGQMTMEEAKEFAEQEALYRSFQDDTKIGSMLRTFKDALNIIGVGTKNGKKLGRLPVHDFGLGDLVIKYTQVPGALIHRTIEFSPVGYVKALYDIGVLLNETKKGGNITKAQRNMALSFGRATTGTGLMVIFYALAKLGLLRRDEDDSDKNAKAMHQAQGFSGTQLNLSGMGRWLEGKDPKPEDGDVLADVNFLEPMDGLMAIATMLAKSDDFSLRGVANQSINGIFESISGLSVIQTLNSIYNAIQYHNDDDKTPYWKEIAYEVAAGSLSGFIPSPVRQFAQATDTVYRDQYRSKDMNDQIRAKVMNSIPGLRQQLAPKITPLGEDKKYQKPVLNYLNATLNPGNVNVYQSNRVVDELNRVYGETDDAKIWPERNAPYSLTANQQSYTLTPDERTQYQRTRGQETARIMEDVIGTGWYKEMDVEQQAKVLNDIGNLANYAAKVEFSEGRGIDYSSDTYAKAYAELQTGSPADAVALLNKKAVAAAEEIHEAVQTIAAAPIPETSKAKAEEMSPNEKILYAGFLKGGVSDATARDLAKTMNGSEATGHEQWREIYSAAPSAEREKAVTSVMTEDMQRNWKLAKNAGVSMDDYIKVRENYKDLDGNGKQKQAEWNATLDSMKFSTDSAKDKSIKGTLWQILTGSSSTKNNPYDKDAGQKVLDAKAKGGGSSGGLNAPASFSRTLKLPTVEGTEAQTRSRLRLPTA